MLRRDDAASFYKKDESIKPLLGKYIKYNEIFVSLQP